MAFEREKIINEEIFLSTPATHAHVVTKSLPKKWRKKISTEGEDN